MVRIIEWSLRHRSQVLAAYALLGAAGWWALTRTPIDAIPDLSDNQVIVFTDWTGRSPQEVEDQITYPLSAILQGLAGVRSVRGQSAFGFSMITIVFEDRVDLYWARTRVLEKLNLAAGQLPRGAMPSLGPDASGVGQVFWYTVEGGGLDLRELRALQDWFIRPQLNSVSGVAEVASVGGQVQQYQVDVDPNRLRAYGIPFSHVVEAVRRSNANVGGNVIEQSGQWSVVRGLGLIASVGDVENIVLDAARGTPVYVRHVARVRLGDAFRTGALDRDGREAVGGVVVARYGVNTLQVIDAVKAKIRAIEPALPPGVRIAPFYDRTELILAATTTLKRALVEEILLVTAAHVVFLMHVRSILIVTIPLPLSVLASFLLMYFSGVGSNLMSLAGIAIAIGVLVDAGIVMTENALRHMETRGVNPRDRRAVWRAVLESTRLIGRPIFFSMAVVFIAFVPVFALTGREGKLFHPLAFTKTFAVGAATVVAVTLVPVLCTLLLGGRVRRERDNPVMRVLDAGYRPVLAAAMAHRAVTVTAAAVLFCGALLTATRIGSEFMPELDEGDVMFMPVTDPAISIDEALTVMQRQDAIIRSFPEVAWVVGKAGRAETATDPAPVNMNETLIHLKPRAQWRPGLTRDALLAEMDRRLAMPGVTNLWVQPIRNRIEMISSGLRAQVGLKVFGSDPRELDRRAREIADLLRLIPGAADVVAEPILGAPYTDVRIDREAAARYGIDVQAVQDVVEAGIGEANVSLTIEGRRRFPVRVRYAPEFRADREQLGRLFVPAPTGAQIPLARLADIRDVEGPAMLFSENGLLRAAVALNVRGRDVAGVVEEARTTLSRRVALPAGYYLEWTGEYEHQQHARARLRVVVAVVLAITFLLLYRLYHSALEAAHLLLAVPFALTGGVYLVYALGYHFSVAVWVGFIALFGTAVQTAVVMVVYLREAVERRRRAGVELTREELRAAVVEGAVLRLRPKVMTVSTVVAALLPIMWSTSVGADVMKPLAAPVLGGMLSSLLHVLIVTPVLFSWLRERALAKQVSAARQPAWAAGRVEET